jgi:hypothetical protein
MIQLEVADICKKKKKKKKTIRIIEAVPGRVIGYRRRILSYAIVNSHRSIDIACV